jgi:hypothetical protein
MSSHDQKASREKTYEFDDSIFKPNIESRIELPGDVEVAFEEVQPFDQIWLWLLMGFEMVIVMIALLTTGQLLWTVAIGLGAITLTMALFSSLKLMTRIDSVGIHYRMKPFHFKVQTIPWEDIDQVHVRKYSPILEYGGWGMRYGRNGKAFNVRGNYGIQIVKKGGKKLLLGTQHPDDAARHLGAHPLLV